MAHEIYISPTGKAAMAYVGQKPWHELGNVLTPGAKTETWAEESGLDFTVSKAEMLYMHNDRLRSAQNKWLLTRSDTGDVLGHGSDRYKIVQPIEALEFFGGIAEEYGYELETAGALHGGAVVWAMAKRPEGIKIKDTEDNINVRILFSTSFDGSSPTLGQHVSERVVCANTLRVSLGQNTKSRVSVRHTATFDANNMRQQLGVAESVPDLWNEFEDDINHMHSISVNKKMQVLAFASRVLEIDDVIQAWYDNHKPLHEIVAATTLAKGSEPTVWGLVNGVSAYTDHMAGRTADSRLSNAWFGRTGLLKDRAYKLAKRVIQGDVSVLEVETVKEATVEAVVHAAAQDFANIMQKPARTQNMEFAKFAI